MKLYRRMQQRLALTIVAATVFTSAAPTVLAADYDGHWAAQSIQEWKDKGVIGGYEDGSFRPKENIKRSELAAILVRVFGLTETKDAQIFSDVKSTDWFAADVAKISAAGIMNTEGTNFNPNSYATREEAAYAVAKAYKITGSTSKAFQDQSRISEWAEDEIDALVAGGYVSGRPDGTFAPKDYLTRADMVTMIDKITAELYNKAGEYSENVEGNIVINTKDVVLKDMTISGNLYISEGVGDGDVTLNNVVVDGEVFVEGGGLNSIKLNGSTSLKKVTVDKANGEVRLVTSGSAKVEQVLVESGVKLEGQFGQVSLAEKAAVEVLPNSTVGKLIVGEDTKDLTIKLALGVTVKEAVLNSKVTLTGSGKVTLVTLAEGMKASDVSLKVTVETVKDSVGKEVTTTPTTTPTTTTPSSDSSSDDDDDDSTPVVSSYRVKGQLTINKEAIDYGHSTYYGSVKLAPISVIEGEEKLDTSKLITVKANNKGEFDFGQITKGQKYGIYGSYDINGVRYESKVYVIDALNADQTLAIDLLEIVNKPDAKDIIVHNVKVIDERTIQVTMDQMGQVKGFVSEISGGYKTSWKVVEGKQITTIILPEGKALEANKEYMLLLQQNGYKDCTISITWDPETTTPVVSSYNIKGQLTINKEAIDYGDSTYYGSVKLAPISVIEGEEKLDTSKLITVKANSKGEFDFGQITKGQKYGIYGSYDVNGVRYESEVYVIEELNADQTILIDLLEIVNKPDAKDIIVHKIEVIDERTIQVTMNKMGEVRAQVATISGGYTTRWDYVGDQQVTTIILPKDKALEANKEYVLQLYQTNYNNYTAPIKWEPKTTTPGEVVANKTNLEAAIKNIEGLKLDKAHYTTESYKALEVALEEAKAVVDDVDATQEAVTKAVNELMAALQGLEEISEVVSSYSIKGQLTINKEAIDYGHSTYYGSVKLAPISVIDGEEKLDTSKLVTVKANDKGEFDFGQITKGQKYGVYGSYDVNGVRYESKVYVIEELNADQTILIDLLEIVNKPDAKDIVVHKIEVIDERTIQVTMDKMGEVRALVATISGGYTTKWEYVGDQQVTTIILPKDKALEANKEYMLQLYQTNYNDYTTPIKWEIDENLEPTYRISGTVLVGKMVGEQSKEVVEGVMVQFYELNEGDYRRVATAYTDEDGKYSIDLESGKIYEVRAWFDDAECNGYYYEEVLTPLKQNLDAYNFTVAQYPVANITVVDQNNRPIKDVKIIPVMNGRHDGWDYTEYEGNVIRYLWGDDATIFNFDFYLAGEKIEPITAIQDIIVGEVKENHNYRMDLKVTLPFSIPSSVTGKLVLENGEVLKNYPLQLWKMEHIEGYGNRADKQVRTQTDEQGMFKFTDIDTNLAANQFYKFYVQARDQKGNSYDVDRMNETLYAFLVKNEIQLQQTYGAIVKVIDKNGIPIKDAMVNISGITTNGSYGAGHNTNAEGIADIHSTAIQPINNVVTVEYKGDRVVTSIEMIPGTYNYETVVQMENTTVNLATIKVTDYKALVGDRIISPATVAISGKGGTYRGDFDRSGEANIVLPEGCDKDLELYIIGSTGEVIYRDKIDLIDGVFSRTIQLSELPHYKVSGELRVVTTSQSYTITTGASVSVYTSNNFFNNVDGIVATTQSTQNGYTQGNLITGSSYILVAQYEENGEKYIGKKSIYARNMSDGQVQDLVEDIQLAEATRLGIKVLDDEGEVCSNTVVQINNQRYITDIHGDLICEDGLGKELVFFIKSKNNSVGSYQIKQIKNQTDGTIIEADSITLQKDMDLIIVVG